MFTTGFINVMNTNVSVNTGAGIVLILITLHMWDSISIRHDIDD